jgi:4-aminobutyrate aminotransferase-like enzyme
VARAGGQLEQGLRHLASRHHAVRDVRGAGAMWGIELDRPAAPVVERALELGLLVNRTADRVIRLLPPYIIAASEIDEGLDLLDRAIGSAAGGGA